MDSNLLLLAGMLTAKFEQAQRFINTTFVDRDPSIDGHATVAMFPTRNCVLAIPDPERDRAQWDELTSFMKEKINVSLAIVLREQQKIVLIVNAPLDFNLCMADEVVWMPKVVNAFEGVMKASDKEAADFLKRLVQSK